MRKAISERTGVPQRFQDFTIDSIDDHPDRAEAKALVGSWVDQLASELPSVGFLLGGPNGTGKSALACVAALEADRSGYAASFISATDYVLAHQRLITLDKVIDKLTNIDADDPPPEILEHRTRYRRLWDLRNTTHLVVLDDLGREHQSIGGWSATLLDNLLRSRVDRGLPVVITTNMNASRLESAYGKAFSSLIYEVCPPVPVGGDDYRRRRAG